MTTISSPQRRAVGIVRVSQVSGRDGESFVSPDQQRERIEQACETRGLKLVKIFDELDVSGGADLSKRPGLSAAVQTIEAGNAEVVAGAYFDRLFRSLRTQAEVAERIEAAGGELLALDSGTIKQGTAGEWLSATMLGAVSEYYRRQAKDRSRDNADKMARRGVTARVPFGFRRNGVFVDGLLTSKIDPERDAKALVADPDTARYVERIFRMRADRRSWADMARWLRGEGIEPPLSSGEWALSTLRNIIANETYIGVLTLGNRRLADEPQCPPPLISRALFNDAQGARTVSRTGRNAAGIAGGLLYCSNCGAPLAVTGTNPAYTCARVRNSTCDRKTYVSKPRTDEWLEALMIKILSEGKLDVLVASRELEQLHQARDDAKAELEAFVTTASALNAPLFQKGVETREAKLKAAEDAYDAALARAEASAEIPDVSGWGALDLDGKRRVARTLIERIVVHSPANRSPRLPVGDRFEVFWRGA